MENARETRRHRSWMKHKGSECTPDFEPRIERRDRWIEFLMRLENGSNKREMEDRFRMFRECRSNEIWGMDQRGCFYESEFLQHRWTKDDAYVYANGSSNDGRKVEVEQVDTGSRGLCFERRGKLLENSGREWIFNVWTVLKGLRKR